MIKFMDVFIQYMRSTGPYSLKSQNNYISWLRYTADYMKFEISDETITGEGKIQDILENMWPPSDNRKVYLRNKDRNNFQSALRKYFQFTSSHFYPLRKK